MSLRACVPAFMIAWLLVAGCGRGTPDSKAVAPDGGAAPKSFGLKGVVRKVDAEAGEVTISHEAIAGFMSKMTMPFTLKDKALLEDVRPGDEVEGRIEVAYEGAEVKDMQVTDLVVTRPSESRPEGADTSPAPAPAVLKPGELVPDFAVTTQEGKTLRLSDLRGQVVALTFIYTRCPSPEFCPAMDAKFADLARRVDTVPGRADRVRLLSISFDPEHDSPEVLAAHAARRGAKPPLWTFAVASHEELAKVAGPFGLAYVAGTREIDHNLRTAVVGPDGRLALLEVGQGWTAADLLKAIYALIAPPRK
jgi:protein SCO1/2